MSKVKCYIQFVDKETTSRLVDELNNNSCIQSVAVLKTKSQQIDFSVDSIEIDSINSSDTIKKIADSCDSEYALIYTGNDILEIGYMAIERFLNVASSTGAGLVYSDFYETKEGTTSNHPVIDYQIGSLRDDFNFGSILFFDSKALKDAVNSFTELYQGAGLYDLRLKVSQNYEFVRIPEYLYTVIEHDTRKSGEKQFDYVDPRNRAIQVEMEKACTNHLKNTGLFLKPEFNDIDLSQGNFPVEASVVIPVRNRVKTIEDAIKSVLIQKFSKSFNLIIVDNHSDDGTSEIIKSYADVNKNIIHITPQRHDLGIGGCWNMALDSSECGRFAIQLDSDDLYKDETTIQQVVDAFYEQKCAMVVGTYQMTNFDLEEIPPGIIDHREWTPENGRNNALRINGLGAPRAFYTPVLRQIKVPNCNYGEDYAVGLAISRSFQIGRIYNPIYLCRRWDENSDASLDIVKTNTHNTYKDRIRTMEIMARKKIINLR